MRSLLLGSPVLLAFALLVMAQVPSTPPVPIRGHVIGESVVDFLAKETPPGLLATCRSATNRKAARKLKVDLKECQQMISDADSKGHFELRLGGESDPSDRGVFDNGQLVALTLYIVDAETLHVYPRVLRDMASRFGEPSRTLEFGDQQQTAEWSRPDVFVKITELPRDRVEESFITFVQIMSREEHDKLAKAKTDADSKDTLQ